MSNFRVSTWNVASPGGGNGFRFTVRRNGVDTSVHCDITGALHSCADTVNSSIGFAAGDLISVSITVAPGFSDPGSKGMIGGWTAQYG